MGKVIKFLDVQKIHGEKVGTVHVSLYKDATNGLPFLLYRA